MDLIIENMGRENTRRNSQTLLNLSHFHDYGDVYFENHVSYV